MPNVEAKEMFLCAGSCEVPWSCHLQGWRISRSRRYVSSCSYRCQPSTTGDLCLDLLQLKKDAGQRNAKLHSTFYNNPRSLPLCWCILGLVVVRSSYSRRTPVSKVCVKCCDRNRLIDASIPWHVLLGVCMSMSSITVSRNSKP